MKARLYGDGRSQHFAGGPQSRNRPLRRIATDVASMVGSVTSEQDQLPRPPRRSSCRRAPACRQSRDRTGDDGVQAMLQVRQSLAGARMANAFSAVPSTTATTLAGRSPTRRRDSRGVPPRQQCSSTPWTFLCRPSVELSAKPSFARTYFVSSSISAEQMLINLRDRKANLLTVPDRFRRDSAFLQQIGRGARKDVHSK
jgi:hypothetical protein